MSAWTNSTSGCSRGAWDTHTNTAARHFARHSDTAVSRQASDELAFQRLLNAAAVGWTSHHSTSVPLQWGGPVTTAHSTKSRGGADSPLTSTVHRNGITDIKLASLIYRYKSHHSDRSKHFLNRCDIYNQCDIYTVAKVVHGNRSDTTQPSTLLPLECYLTSKHLAPFSF